jgi:hypothetical protein
MVAIRENGTNKLMGVIGTINLPERQINGSRGFARGFTFARSIPCLHDESGCYIESNSPAPKGKIQK